MQSLNYLNAIFICMVIHLWRKLILETPFVVYICNKFSVFNFKRNYVLTYFCLFSNSCEGLNIIFLYFNKTWKYSFKYLKLNLIEKKKSQTIIKYTNKEITELLYKILYIFFSAIIFQFLNFIVFFLNGLTSYKCLNLCY